MAFLPAKQERAATAAFLRRGSASWLWLGVFLGVVTMLYGCDNTIEPFDEETGLFSIYGYLSLSEESNVIRIRDLNTPLLRDSTRELDAKATLENLDDGTTEQLKSNRIEFDGIYVHNFEVTMPVEPETEYRLTVERSDGAQATSTATTPTLGEVTYGPEGEDCYSPIRITFRDIDDPLLVPVSLSFYVDGDKWKIQWYPVRGEGDTAVLEFTAEEVAKFFECDETLGCPPKCAASDDEEIHVHYYHFGPEWINEDIPWIDQDIPINPLESLDIDDGLGFFGGLREGSFTIAINPSKEKPQNN